MNIKSLYIVWPCHSVTDYYHDSGHHWFRWWLVTSLHQAITRTNTDGLSLRPLGRNFSEIRIEIWNVSFRGMHFKMSSAKWLPFCSLSSLILPCCPICAAIWPVIFVQEIISNFLWRDLRKLHVDSSWQRLTSTSRISTTKIWSRVGIH